MVTLLPTIATEINKLTTTGDAAVSASTISLLALIPLAMAAAVLVGIVGFVRNRNGGN